MDFLDALIPADPGAQVALHLALHLVHSGMVAFMLLGWLYRPLLLAHRVMLALIWASWLGLGWYVGFIGYCVLTDWHWRLKEAMGEYGMPPSYIEYMLWQVWPDDLPDALVAYMTGGVFVLLTFASLWRWRRSC